MKQSWWLYVEAITKVPVPAMHSSSVDEILYIYLNSPFEIQALHSEVSLEWSLVHMCYVENL